MNPVRSAHLDEFYRLLDQLASRDGGPAGWRIALAAMAGRATASTSVASAAAPACRLSDQVDAPDCGAADLGTLITCCVNNVLRYYKACAAIVPGQGHGGCLAAKAVPEA